MVIFIIASCSDNDASAVDAIICRYSSGIYHRKMFFLSKCLL